MSGVAERSPGTVEQLRERIRKLQAAPRSYLATLRTGVGAFDSLLPAGGLPLGQAVELCGEAASGRTGSGGCARTWMGRGSCTLRRPPPWGWT